MAQEWLGSDVLRRFRLGTRGEGWWKATGFCVYPPVSEPLRCAKRVQQALSSLMGLAARSRCTPTTYQGGGQQLALWGAATSQTLGIGVSGRPCDWAGNMRKRQGRRTGTAPGWAGGRVFGFGKDLAAGNLQGMRLVSSSMDARKLLSGWSRSGTKPQRVHTEVESRGTWGRYLEEREFTNGWLRLGPRCGQQADCGAGGQINSQAQGSGTCVGDTWGTLVAQRRPGMPKVTTK